jgi:hypothetical protein
MTKTVEGLDGEARYIVAGSYASSAMPTIAMGYQSKRSSELLQKRRKSGNREDI